MAAKSNFCTVAGTAQTVGWTMDGEEDSGLPLCLAAAKEPEGSFTLAAAEGGWSGQGIGADVLLASDMPDVRHVFRQVTQLSCLPCCPWI
jgi:hypothetical protein